MFLHYLLAINLFAFLLYASDKRKAYHRRWRIPERVLWLVAFAGGSSGALLSMHLFHHKTHHLTFRYGMPLLLALQLLLVMYAEHWY